MSLFLVNTQKLNVYDGYFERCFLHDATVKFDFDNGARVVTLTTNGDGRLTNDPTNVSQKYTTARITVQKDYHKTFAVKAKVVWNGDEADLGVDGVHVREL